MGCFYGRKTNAQVQNLFISFPKSLSCSVRFKSTFDKRIEFSQSRQRSESRTALQNTEIRLLPCSFLQTQFSKSNGGNVLKKERRTSSSEPIHLLPQIPFLVLLWVISKTKWWIEFCQNRWSFESKTNPTNTETRLLMRLAQVRSTVVSMNHPSSHNWDL